MRGAVVRGLLAALVALIALALPFGRRAEAAFDPALRFYTIETEHFRITYHTGLEQVAQHVANTCESIYDNMTEAMGYAPKKDKTEVLLVDNSESANGSASALPYNAIRLLVTAPEDFSPLGDVDDWYLELVTHEYTHVLHTDHIRGIPALVNTVLGKTMAPNQVQPRWILEGYGVYFESARTSAGRLRNSMWDMFMRTDVLDDNLASLDQISNVVRRWPQGNIFYLYGSHFIQWIARTYGEKALRQVAYDYGGQLIPWGIQRTIRRATGKTYDELYPLWIESMKREYGAQAAEVRRRGIREGVRLTHHGQIARYPRWIPDNAWPEHAGGLLYYRDGQHDRPGLFALDVTRDASGRVAPRRREGLRARRAHEHRVVRELPPRRRPRLRRRRVLPERLPLRRPRADGAGAEEPLRRARRKARPAHRARDARLRSHDVPRRPSRRLHPEQGGDALDPYRRSRPTGVSNVRPLVPTAFLEQSFTPRWSPDGTHVAYSVWKRGGYRDIRYVDVRDGTSREITNDRAVDGSPSFSADGKWLFFHSDRTGIMNVYAYELATGRLKQVTNVLTGAYSPEPSPDGKTLAYVGYGKNGFDLYAMPLGPLDGSTWLDAPEYVDTHPTPPPVTNRRWEPKPYSPWRTLLPRRYGVQITPGNFGQAVIVDAAGSDIAGLHGVSATSTVELEKPEIQGSLGYSYVGLPVDFSASVFRSITPRAGYAIGQYKPTIIQETAGVTTSLAYAQPKAFDGRSYVVSHTVSRVGANLPMPADKLDPYETPSIPVRGLASTMHFGYAFSNAERYLWSIGPERGYSLNLNFDITDPLLGSDFAGFATNGDFSTYFLMPWLKHHSLALHAGGGTSGGSFPGRGAFFVGGFVDLPVVDTVRNFLIQGGITLRGYAPVAVAGRSYALGNAEYRFPIVNIDRGDSTLPIFLNRISGSVFVDYGSAFDVFRDARFKTGVGGELWFDTLLGYVAPFTFRVGYAKGLASLGIDKVYFVAAVPY